MSRLCIEDGIPCGTPSCCKALHVLLTFPDPFVFQTSRCSGLQRYIRVHSSPIAPLLLILQKSLKLQSITLMTSSCLPFSQMAGVPSEQVGILSAADVVLSASDARRRALLTSAPTGTFLQADVGVQAGSYLAALALGDAVRASEASGGAAASVAASGLTGYDVISVATSVQPYVALEPLKAAGFCGRVSVAASSEKVQTSRCCALCFFSSSAVPSFGWSPFLGASSKPRFSLQ